MLIKKCAWCGKFMGLVWCWEWGVTHGICGDDCNRIIACRTQPKGYDTPQNFKDRIRKLREGEKDGN